MGRWPHPFAGTRQRLFVPQREDSHASGAVVQSTPCNMKRQTRRSFLKRSMVGSAGLALLPNILTRSLFAADLPSKLIHIAQIGCGREGRVDVEGTMVHPLARVVAVCDLDSKRAASAQEMIANFYKKKGESEVKIDAHHNYREVFARPDIDAVI